MITEDQARSLYPWMPEDQFLGLLQRLRERGTLGSYYPEQTPYRSTRYRDPNLPKQRKYWCQYPHDELTVAYGQARKEHAFLLRCEGLKLKEIGNRLGITKERARALIANQGWRMAWRLRNVRWTWLNAPSSD